jgi:hypothetical protein
MSSIHNLDIKQYSFYDILALFGLDVHDITEADLHNARRHVLRMHPDKSKLPSEYFLFYKKAYDIVHSMYNDRVKTTKHIEKNHEYMYVPEKVADVSQKQMKKTIGKISPEKFNSTFNDLFEKHSTANTLKHINPHVNDWFTEDSLDFDKETVHNTSDIGNAFDRMKEKSKANELVRYKGVVPLSMNGTGTQGGGAGLYDDDGENADQYLTSDPFSKLKYDDLRKVHKDQTILSVSEHDINQVKQYSSVDHCLRDRTQDLHTHTPMSREAAEKQIRTEKGLLEESVRRRQYNSQMRTQEALQNNKTVLSAFLQLT